ncbi:MAG: hypothetical protein F6K36_29445 [Symploca sp. SIO3C6]|nr:hypothetical protein [Symploca sp. SIO3C6]
MDFTDTTHTDKSIHGTDNTIKMDIIMDTADRGILADASRNDKKSCTQVSVQDADKIIQDNAPDGIENYLDGLLDDDPVDELPPKKTQRKRSTSRRSKRRAKPRDDKLELLQKGIEILEPVPDRTLDEHGQGHYYCPACDSDGCKVSLGLGKERKPAIICYSCGDESSAPITALREKVSGKSTSGIRASKPTETVYTYKNKDGDDVLQIQVTYTTDGSKRPYQKYIIDGDVINGGDVDQDQKDEIKASITLYNFDCIDTAPLTGGDGTAHDFSNCIFWVEGEKCVEALKALGLAAICSQGGSKTLTKKGGEWRVADYSSELKQIAASGRTVVLMPDRDTSGVRYMDNVYFALKEAKVETVKFCYIEPDHHDWQRIIEHSPGNVHINGQKSNIEKVCDHPGYDVADLIETGLTTQYQLLSYIANRCSDTRRFSSARNLPHSSSEKKRKEYYISLVDRYSYLAIKGQLTGLIIPCQPVKEKQDGTIEAKDLTKSKPTKVEASVIARAFTRNQQGQLLVDSLSRQPFRYDPTTGNWIETNKNGVMSMVSQALETASPAIEYTKKLVNEIGEIVLANTYTENAFPSTGSVRYINMKNGTYDVEKEKLVPFNPEHKVTGSLMFDYDEFAECPSIKAWLNDLCFSNEDVVKVIITYIKICLLERQPEVQKFLQFKGAGGAGKSSLFTLIRCVLGDKNCARSTLAKFDEQNNFEVALIRNKKAVFFSDERMFHGDGTNLKGAIGGDPLPYTPKFVQAKENFTYYGGFFIGSNFNISFKDEGGAISRRQIMINTRKTERIPGVSNLISIRSNGEPQGYFTNELPGFFNWVMSITEDDISSFKDTVNNIPALVNAQKKNVQPSDSVEIWMQTHLYASREFRGGSKLQPGRGHCPDTNDVDRFAYISYRAMAERDGNKAVSFRNFSEQLQDKVSQLNIPGNNASRDDKNRLRPFARISKKSRSFSMFGLSIWTGEDDEKPPLSPEYIDLDCYGLSPTEETTVLETIDILETYTSQRLDENDEEIEQTIIDTVNDLTNGDITALELKAIHENLSMDALCLISELMNNDEITALKPEPPGNGIRDDIDSLEPITRTETAHKVLTEVFSTISAPKAAPSETQETRKPSKRKRSNVSRTRQRER